MAFKVQVGPPQIAIHQGQTVLVTDLDGTITWPSERVATLPHCGPSLRTVTSCPRARSAFEVQSLSLAKSRRGE